MLLANILQNSVGTGINLARGGEERFKILKPESHFSTGAYIPSGFNKKTFSVPKKINKEDLPRGRPLW